MANRTRNNRITFRMSDKEYKVFLQKVEKSKLTQNEYMIKCIMGKKIIVVDGLKEISQEISRIGANINQISKNLNSGIFQGATEDIKIIKDELLKVTDRIISVLKEVNK